MSICGEDVHVSMHYGCRAITWFAKPCFKKAERSECTGSASPPRWVQDPPLGPWVWERAKPPLQDPPLGSWTRKNGEPKIEGGGSSKCLQHYARAVTSCLRRWRGVSGWRPRQRRPPSVLASSSGEAACWRVHERGAMVAPHGRTYAAGIYAVAPHGLRRAHYKWMRNSGLQIWERQTLLNGRCDFCTANASAAGAQHGGDLRFQLAAHLLLDELAGGDRSHRMCARESSHLRRAHRDAHRHRFVVSFSVARPPALWGRGAGVVVGDEAPRCSVCLVWVGGTDRVMCPPLSSPASE